MNTENKPNCLGLTAEKHSAIPPLEPGGTYDTEYQHPGAMEILDSDNDGNEFPAAPGWYFKQFVPHGGDWISINGWFGPYGSIAEMPEIVRANLTADKATK